MRDSTLIHCRLLIMSLEKTIELIAWDANSQQHIERLQSQREQCGWSRDKVAGLWRDGQLKGTKVLYWIVRIRDNIHESANK